MKREDPLWRFVRMSWPVLGGAWGAWSGFAGYLALAPNADSFGSVLALGYFAFFALIGLVAGAASAALIGGLVAAVLQRCGVGMAGALLIATLVNVLAISQLTHLVQTRYPGLRADGQPGDRAPVHSSCAGEGR